jgi:hypothetical protein
VTIPIKELEKGVDLSVGNRTERVYASLAMVVGDEVGIREMFRLPSCRRNDFTRWDDLAKVAERRHGASPLTSAQWKDVKETIFEGFRDDRELHRRFRDGEGSSARNTLASFPAMEFFGPFATGICLSHLFVLGILKNHVLPKLMVFLRWTALENAPIVGKSGRKKTGVGQALVDRANAAIERLTRHCAGESTILPDVFSVGVSRTLKIPVVRIIGQSSAVHMTDLTSSVAVAFLEGPNPLLTEAHHIDLLNTVCALSLAVLREEPFDVDLVTELTTRLQQSWKRFVETDLRRVPGFKNAQTAIPVMDTLNHLVVTRQLLGPFEFLDTLSMEQLNSSSKGELHLAPGPGLLRVLVYLAQKAATRTLLTQADFEKEFLASLKRASGHPVGFDKAPDGVFLPTGLGARAPVVKAAIARVVGEEGDIRTVSGYYWDCTEVSLLRTPTRFVAICYQQEGNGASERILNFALPIAVFAARRKLATGPPQLWVLARPLMHSDSGLPGWGPANGCLSLEVQDCNPQLVAFADILHGRVAVVPSTTTCLFAGDDEPQPVEPPRKIVADPEPDEQPEFRTLSVTLRQELTDESSSTSTTVPLTHSERLARHVNFRVEGGSKLYLAPLREDVETAAQMRGICKELYPDATSARFPVPEVPIVADSGVVAEGCASEDDGPDDGVGSEFDLPEAQLPEYWEHREFGEQEFGAEGGENIAAVLDHDDETFGLDIEQDDADTGGEDLVERTSAEFSDDDGDGENIWS